MEPRLLSAIRRNVRDALDEDVGRGDLTAALIDAARVAGATIIARDTAVVAGRPWVDEVFRQVDESVILDWYADDGRSVGKGDILCKIVGNARSLLTGERTALNFLQTLSATATATAAYVAAVAGTRARILDTRKTLPGLRLAQKYAVRAGGGTNHRTGLYDAILIKENHIRSAGGIAGALEAAHRHAAAGVPVEIEVESLAELRQALDAGATRILLDNFSLEDLRAAVTENHARGGSAAELEASGNVTLDTVRGIAETGVDYISTGAITKNVVAADLSMLFRID
ncbi:MAG TPA: carboxylating nicotinate-nucleotide diphosphorylase [Woeseiaceae bacterium]|nr:carboxylating nicotinate-nucleotide diphosphorylase [Woeseiaceae bacterium]